MGDEATQAGTESATSNVEFELDLTAPAAAEPSPTLVPSEAAAASPRTPAAAAPSSPTESPEYRTLQRELSELRQQFTPYLQDLQRRTLDTAAQPPVDPKKIESGEATAAELMQYLKWERENDLRRLQLGTEATARRATSENQARGTFNAAALGDGRDYDSLRAKYLEPAYRTNPALREAIATLSPDAPAIAEMYTATFLHLRELNGGDDVKALKAIFDGATARADTEKDITGKINEAAKRGADRIVRGQQSPGAGPKKLSATDLWNLNDDEFKQLQRQTGN